MNGTNSLSAAWRKAIRTCESSQSLKGSRRCAMSNWVTISASTSGLLATAAILDGLEDSVDVGG